MGMKSAEFTNKQLYRLGIQLEKVKYCTRVYETPMTKPPKLLPFSNRVSGVPNT